MEKPVVFKNNKGQQLVGMLHLPKTIRKVPIVIVCHGFHGSKTRTRFVKLGRRLSEQKIALFRFDCAGHGDSEGECRNITLSQELKDLEAAFEYVSKLKAVDRKRIGLLGESFGSIVVTLFALRHPQVKTIVLWAPALNQKLLFPEWYTQYEIRKWKKQGYFDERKYRTGVQFLREVEKKNFVEEAIKLTLPILIVQGTRDDTVPPSESKQLFRKLVGPKKLLMIKGGDHVLERYDVRQKVVRATVSWFEKYL